MTKYNYLKLVLSSFYFEFFVTILSLEKLYNKIEKKGINLFDEYTEPKKLIKWTGESNVIDEYLV